MTGISTRAEIKIIFQAYQRPTVSVAFPQAGILSDYLAREAEKAGKVGQDVFVADRDLVKLFASAAVEMWHRALHSYILSAGLASTSPIWSSVAGYYASHYVVRGYAHLLGRYVLYRKKKVASLCLDQGQFYCRLDGKGAEEREHKSYWKFVKTSAEFGSDPFLNVDNCASPVSDQAHRTKANYFDHVGSFLKFRALTQEATVERIERISGISLSAIPVPDADDYPDLESVQIMAYHRIVRFRKYLDDLLGDRNNFWNTHRRPQWCQDIIDFQITEAKLLSEVAS